MKQATINIYKNLVLAEIDAQTFKRVDGVLSTETDQVKNALSSDSEESLDMNILHSHMEKRAAEIRQRLTFCLIDDSEDLNVTNELEKDKESFEYALVVPDTFKRAKLKNAARAIHNYIVQGVLCDWYATQNLKGNVSEDDLMDMADEIVSMFRTSFVKRPLQPFGPR